MELLDAALLERFDQVGMQDVSDPIILAHYYNPYGTGDWYVASYDPLKERFYGWVERIPGMGEWGFFYLGQLEFEYGLLVIRDASWKESKSSKVIPY
jgi:hypothetical protein